MESKNYKVLASKHLVYGRPEVPTRHSENPGALSDYSPTCHSIPEFSIRVMVCRKQSGEVK